MTDTATPRACHLHLAHGRYDRCPGASCPFWEDGCLVERLAVPVVGEPQLATWMLDLRASLEAAAATEARAAEHAFHRALARGKE